MSGARRGAEISRECLAAPSVTAQGETSRILRNHANFLQLSGDAEPVWLIDLMA